MSHVLQISDAAYNALKKLATQQGQSPEAVLEDLIASASANGGPYYETEEWFRHLGMTEDEIHQAREQADREDANA
jgi:hypothetical protein